MALGALFNERRYDELVSLAEEFPGLYTLDDEFASLKGWSFFHIGRVMEARSIARDLVGRRANQNDIELAINTAVESGDWGYLQSILIREIASQFARTSRLNASFSLGLGGGQPVR